MSSQQLINLTPHALIILKEDGEGSVEGVLGYGKAAVTSRFRVVAELPSAGVARAVTTVTVVGEVEVAGEKLPVTKTSFGAPEGLPEPQEGAMYVVSLLTAQAAAAAGRTTDDLLVVGETVRNAGNIVGCTGFGRV